MMMKAIILFVAVLISGEAYGQYVAALCTAPEIRQKVCALDPTYNPDPGINKPGDDYVSAGCAADGGLPADALNSAKDAIRDAFVVAPKLIKQGMCNLYKIFIVNDSAAGWSWSSWGKWEEPIRYTKQSAACVKTNGCSFVGIGSSVLVGSPGLLPPPKLDKLRNNVLDAFGVDTGAVFYQHAAAGVPSERVAVLDTLAHEIGHIKFHRDNLWSQACFTNNFIANSWPDPGMFQVWLPFKKDLGTHPDVPKLVNAGVPAKPLEVVTILASGFATGFASMSPEEDYVESLTLFAISKGNGGGTLNLNGPGGSQQVNDIPNRDAVVQAKLAAGAPCF